MAMAMAMAGAGTMRELQQYHGASLRQFQRHEAWLDGLQKRYHGEKRDAVTRLCSIRALRSTPLCDYISSPGLLTELASGFPHATTVDLRYLIGALNRVFWFAGLRAKAMAGDGGIRIINGRVPTLRTPPAWVRDKVIAMAADGCRATEIKAKLWISDSYVDECLGRGDVEVDVEPLQSPATVSPPTDEPEWVELVSSPQQLSLVPSARSAWDLSSILSMINELTARASLLVEEGTHER